MAGSRYVPITVAEFTVQMDQMGFKRVPQETIPGTFEMVWERPVTFSGSGRSFPYAVRIYSSIDVSDGVSRDVGADAIRLVLLNRTQPDREFVLKSCEHRVFRTKGALQKVKERARELFQYILDNECPQCGKDHGGIFVRRDVKRPGAETRSFMGCTRYPLCKASKDVPKTEAK